MNNMIILNLFYATIFSNKILQYYNIFLNNFTILTIKLIKNLYRYQKCYLTKLTIDFSNIVPQCLSLL